MEAATRSRNCEALHAEMSVPQLRGGGLRERTTVSVDDDHDEPSSAVASVLVEASTSGRVESAFWDERRQPRRRRRRAWVSPTGVLYVVDRPSNFLYNELEQGRKVEENVSIDLKHSVSTCFEQGRLGEEKSMLMTTSHKLDANHLLTTHYANNLDGDYEVMCNTSHAMLPVSRLSTCLNLTSIGDPTLEVELEQEQESKKLSETILANLRTGERLLKLQFKNNITDNVGLSNTYITDLRGKHSVNLKADLPLFGFANISKSFTTNFQESHEFCLNVLQRISELHSLKTQFIRNNNQVSVELRHVAQGTNDVAVKLIRDHQGTTHFNVTTSHTGKAKCWGWTFRKVSGEAYSVGVEWKRQVNPDKFFVLRTCAQNKRCTVYAELRRPF